MLLPRTMASTTGRPWYWLARHSSILPLFHGHSNLGASMVSKSTFKWGSNAGSKWPKILQISSNNHTQALNEKKSINYNIKHIIFPKNRENDPKIIYILSTYQLLCGSLQCTVLRMALIGQGQKSYGTKYLLRHAVHHNENSYRQVCLCSNHILMSIISYNVQGAKKLQVIQEIKFFTRTQRPDMILLLKTMVNEKNIKIILSLMGYDHFDYVLPNNHLGGLAVLWERRKYPRISSNQEQ